MRNLRNPKLELQEIMERIATGIVGSLRRWWFHYKEKAKEVYFNNPQQISVLLNIMANELTKAKAKDEKKVEKEFMQNKYCV